jgi:glycosyltransferase involved in cell wall biosynthesis
MRLMFFYRVGEDVGSAQTIRNYAQVARALGHEIAVYGKPRPASPVPYSLDVESADAVVFIFEFCLELHYAGFLNLVRLISKVPRERRIVIDDDGAYNDMIQVNGDYNHLSTADSRARTELFESISDKILQPTFHPVRPNVRTFLFHAYNPALEVPLAFRTKQNGMYYVGHNWFRWRALCRVLEAVRPIREHIGRIGIAGYGWEEPARWIEPQLREVACYTDPSYLAQFSVEFLGPVPVTQVVSSMSRGIFCPVLVRPLFNHLRLANPRLFETPAANTIPVFGLDPEYVREIYGDEATALVLPTIDPADKVLDIIERPDYYGTIVRHIRRRLAERHSYETRLQELIEIVKN